MPIQTVIVCKNISQFNSAVALMDSLAIHHFDTRRNNLQIVIYHQDNEESDYDRGFEVGSIQCLKNLIETGAIR